MDLTQVKDIATIAAPLVKVVVDEFIAPKFKQLLGEKKVSIKMTAHSFENQFHSYLLESYKKYSTPNILVLGNQQRRLKDIYIPLEVINESNHDERHIIDDFRQDFIPLHKKVLIIDTAGMGKSTLSKRLFLAVVEQNIGVPILVELRRLNKGKKMIDEIFRQLSMINEKANEDFVLELIRKGGFIFMLDGFDEIEHEEKKLVVEEIRNFIDKAGENYFLLTSRPEDALGSFGDFLSFNIRPLYIEEAYNLLGKYDSNGEISSLLIAKLEERENSNVKEFLENPLLVSLLFAAFEHKQTIPLKKHMFYRQVYDAFFERHDLTKGDSYIRNKYTKLESDDFHRVLRYVGYYCLKIDKVEFYKDELIKILQQAKVFCVDLKFNPSDFLKDVLTKVPLFVEDGLYIKWAHKSIQEYFAATFIYNDAKANQGAVLTGLAKESSYRYFNVLDIYYSVDYKSFRRFVIYNLLNSYLEHLAAMRMIWPELSNEVATILFTDKYTFTKYSSTSFIENPLLLKRLEDFVSDNWDVVSIFYTNEASNNFIKAFSAERPYSCAFHVVVSKRLGFLSYRDGREVVSDKGKRKRYSEGTNSDYAHLPIKEGDFIIIDGLEADDLLKDMDIDSLFKSFVFMHRYIDEKKAKLLIEEINKEIAAEQSDNFLLIGS